MRKFLILLSAVVAMTACNNSWPCGWDARPADCLDTEEMNTHYNANPQRWNAVFEFLRNTDLAALEVGEYEIVGRDAYAVVSEYEPKEMEEVRYEGHRLYVDLQYVISGEEQIGVVKIGDLQEVDPYSVDAAFFGTEIEGAVFEKADPSKFFIFFPDDLHKPSVRTAEGVTVKKVVVKVLY